MAKVILIVSGCGLPSGKQWTHAKTNLGIWSHRWLKLRSLSLPILKWIRTEQKRLKTGCYQNIPMKITKNCSKLRKLQKHWVVFVLQTTWHKSIENVLRYSQNIWNTFVLWETWNIAGDSNLFVLLLLFYYRQKSQKWEISCWRGVRSTIWTKSWSHVSIWICFRGIF